MRFVGIGSIAAALWTPHLDSVTRFLLSSLLSLFYWYVLFSTGMYQFPEIPLSRSAPPRRLAKPRRRPSQREGEEEEGGTRMAHCLRLLHVFAQQTAGDIPAVVFAEHIDASRAQVPPNGIELGHLAAVNLLFPQNPLLIGTEQLIEDFAKD